MGYSLLILVFMLDSFKLQKASLLQKQFQVNIIFKALNTKKKIQSQWTE